MSVLLSTSRRRFLAGTAGASLFSVGVFRNARATTSDLQSLAIDAFIWGFTLVLTGRYCQHVRNLGFSFNRFHNDMRPATPNLVMVGPNVDTIYGMAFIDVSKEPQVLTVPDTDDRYYSIQLIDAYENTFLYIGRRTTGTKVGAYAITAPGWTGALPSDVQKIEAPTSLVWACARTMVKQPDDLPNAQAIQAQYTLGPLSAYINGVRTTATADENILNIPALDLSDAGAEFFDELCTLLAKYPPRPEDAVHLERFAKLGIVPGGKPSLDKEISPILAAAVPAALKKITDANFFREKIGAWYGNRKLWDYTVPDPLLRAALNIYGPFYHLLPEAVYFSTLVDGLGEPLSGDRAYTITFPKGQLPPVDAFWSVTMYRLPYALVANPIDRYSINSFTPDLEFDPDGSLVIRIQHDEPESGPANWLPSPDSGHIRIVARNYQPRPALLNGSYEMPPVLPVWQ